MKKIVLVILGLSLSVAVFAQKKNIQSAKNELKFGNYEEAIKYIDMALADPTTKDDPKAWLVKSEIYYAMQQEAKYKEQKPYREAADALIKVVELKPDYEQQAVNQNLMNAAFTYFNEAVGEYNSRNFDEAIRLAGKTVEIHGLQGGKRFNMPSFDTVAAQAKLIMANSAYFGDKKEQAIPILLELKDNPAGRTENIYVMLTNVYKDKGQDDKLVATIEEGLQYYPKSEQLRVERINYYMRTGQQDKMIKNLEDAIAANPNEPEYVYHLANAYNDMAFPQSGQPDNYSELIAKSEEYYNRALAMSPSNPSYLFNAGILYYNQAIVVQNTEIATITGTDAAAQKKYEELKAKRDAMFNKALVPLDKALNILGPKADAGTLKPEERNTYASLLETMNRIYVTLNNEQKAKEIKDKIQNMK